MVHVFARVRSRPEHVDAVRQLLQRLRAASRKEAGVTQYDVFETEQFGEFFFAETYADAAAFAAHTQARHVRLFGARVVPLLAEPLQLWQTQPVAVES